MRIELDLPDWVEGRDIHILYGIEEVAKKRAGGKWRIKTERCSMCGTCCKDCDDLKPYPRDRYFCVLGGKRPFDCCVGDGNIEDGCSVRWD